MSEINQLKQTALYSEHLAAKAKMVSFAGYHAPIQYCSLKEEALVVRHSCGIFDVSHMGEFVVSGKDAVCFVDHLICNDFAGAAIGKAVYSPLLRADGTIIDDLIAYKLTSEKVLLCVNGTNVEKDWRWVCSQEKIAGFKNLKVENKSDDFSLLAVQGPQSESFLRDLGFSFSKNYPRYSVGEERWREENIILARTGYTGEDGFEIFISHQGALSLWRALIEKGVLPCGLGARDVLRIEAGYPLYGQEIHDKLTPYDSGLKWTVKMKKNFFIGRTALETFAPHYRLIKLILPRGIPRSGHKLLNEKGKVVGQVTSGTLSVVLNRGIAMAHLERCESIDQKFLVKIRHKNYNCFIHKGAFLP